MLLKSGHTVKEVEGDEFKRLVEEFWGHRLGVIRLMPQKWFLPKPFIQFSDKIRDFKLNPSDVIVMSFMKCGSTWMQEIVWNLLHNPNLNNPKVNEPMFNRSSVIDGDAYTMCFNEPGNVLHDEFVAQFPYRDPSDGIFLQRCELAQEPRVFKAHAPFELLPPSTLDTCKVIYTSRDPRDVVVSYYKFSKTYKNYDYRGDIDSFIDHFISDNVIAAPFWTHVKQAWELRNHPNLYFVHYEDLKSNTKHEVTRIQNFLGLKLTDKQINNVVEFTSFEAMKQRQNLLTNMDSEAIANVNILEKEGGFFSKGTFGTWKERLNEQQIKKIDDWTSKNMANFQGDFKYKH